MGIASLLEHNIVAGGWTDPEGHILCELAAHSVVEGHEKEILMRTALAGRDIGMASFAIALRCPKGEGRVFRVSLKATGVWSDQMDKVCEPLLRAGARGVDALLNRPELRILALDREHAEVVRLALSLIPADLSPRVEEEPAHVDHVPSCAYRLWLAEKDDGRDPQVMTEVFLGGAANGLGVRPDDFTLRDPAPPHAWTCGHGREADGGEGNGGRGMDSGGGGGADRSAGSPGEDATENR